MRKVCIRYADLHPREDDVRRAFIQARSSRDVEDALQRWYDPATEWAAGPSGGTRRRRRPGRIGDLPMRTLLVAVLALSLTAAAPQETKKLVLVAGKMSHGPGDHEFRAGSMLLQKCLAKFPGLEVVVVSNGWPEDVKVFDGAAAIVCYADGGGGHPFIQGDRAKLIDGFAKKASASDSCTTASKCRRTRAAPNSWTGSAGTTRTRTPATRCGRRVPEVPRPSGRAGRQALQHQRRVVHVHPLPPRDEGCHLHPRGEAVGQGPRRPVRLSEGPYDHIVKASGQDETMMWCVERDGGGRGFGFTGGHRHKNWGDDNHRKVVLNALVWLCKLEVPPAASSRRSRPRICSRTWTRRKSSSGRM
jgi:hypothetical protein